MKNAILFTLLISLSYAAEIVPASATNSARYRASGTLQINCTAVGTVSGPLNIQSTLTDLSSGANAGTYTSSGFTAADGSATRVTVTINSTSNAPNLTNFLASGLRVAGDRVLDRIVFITRYDTQGGTLDASTCTADNVGTLTTVPFSASYGFYRSAVPDVQGATLVRTLRAVGTLQLVCTNQAYAAPSSISSVLRTVDGANTEVGIYNGSFVSNADGSATRATGNVATPVNNAPQAALTNFVQTATNTAGSRIFDNIAFITRYDTVGGVATAADTPCTTSNDGSVLNKNFEATYGFYQSNTATTTSSSTISRNSANVIGMSALFVSGLVFAAL